MWKAKLTRITSVFSFLTKIGFAALGLASGGLSVLFALWFYLQGKDPPKSGLVMFLLGCSVAAAWIQWWKERRKWIDLLEKQRPQLTIAPADFFCASKSWRTLHLTGQDAPCGSSDASCLRVRVENKSGQATQLTSIAQNVVAKAIFFELENSRELFSSEGWWPEYFVTGDDGDKSINYHKARNIAPGSKETLELIFKFGWQSEAYGISEEIKQFPNWQNGEWALGVGKFAMKLQLRGENVAQDFRLTFSNPGRGYDLMAETVCEVN